MASVDLEDSGVDSSRPLVIVVMGRAGPSGSPVSTSRAPPEGWCLVLPGHALMSFTALLWVVLYSSAILASIVNPIFGALGYLLEYYMRPELKWWGDELPSLRYNLIVSVVLGVTFLLRRSSLRAMAKVPNLALPWLLALGAIMLVVTPTVAVDLELSWHWSVQWVKLAVIFPLLIVGVVRSRATFNAFVVAHMLGALWWGYEAWDDPKRQAGRLVNIGSGDSLDDNTASAHLLTVLPFCIVYLLTERSPRLRSVAAIATPLVINTIILCNSRGATVGLIAAAAASVFLVRSGNRLRMVVAGVGLLASLYLLADEQFIARQQTTTNYEEDGSAQQRLLTWKGAYELVKDRPYGAGGRGFHILSPIYAPEVVALHGGDQRAPHNTYAMVASEWGVLGLISYVGIYGSAFLMTRRIKRAAAVRGDGGRFYYWRALAIQLGMTAYLVAGAFTDRLYGEAGYWLIALAYALYRVQCTDDAEEIASTEAAGISVGMNRPPVVPAA